MKKKMKTYQVKFTDVIEAGSEEEAWDIWRAYMLDCIQSGDITVFDFEEINEEKFVVWLDKPRLQNCSKNRQTQNSQSRQE